MAEYILAEKAELVAIADATRAKCNTVDKMSLSQIADSILTISGGGEANPPAVGFVPTVYNSTGYPTMGIFYGTSIPTSLFACNQSDGYPFALQRIIWNDTLTSISAYAFREAKKLTIPELPDTVTRIASYAFSNCTSLTWTKLPTSLTNVEGYAFNNCTGFTSLDVTGKVNFANNAFKGCSGLRALKLHSDTVCIFNGKNTFDGTPIISGGDGYIFVPHTLVDSYKALTNLSGIVDNIVPLDGFAVIPKVDYNLEYSETKSISIKLLEYDTMPNVQISSSNTNILTVTNINKTINEVTFDVNALSTEGTATINMTVSDSISTYQGSFNISVFAEIPYRAIVEDVEGSTYGFVLNKSGYYESANKGKDSSYALCKVNIKNSAGARVYIDCINYAENNYDYGLLSKVNTTLALSNTADTTNVFKNFKGTNASTVQTLDYGVVADGSYIYIKFIKDNSGSQNNDSLQFKVRFETA